MKSKAAGQKPLLLSRDLHPGPSGLNIPELTEDATDDEIYAAIANLHSAKEKLSAAGKELAENAQDILSSYSIPIQVRSDQEMTQERAAGKSDDIKTDLKAAAGRVTHSSSLSDL
ncbi:MAG: hypothetical protein HGA78_03730 [Nitrospirales bacterium]|nr:hypothetical protein [Nitrospirales bacterium]